MDIEHEGLIEDMTSREGLTRRGFLKGAALGAMAAGVASAGVAGAGLAGCTPTGSGAGGSGSTDTPSANAGGGSGMALNPQDYDYNSNSITDFSSAALFSPWKLGPFELSHRMVKSAAFQLAFLKNIPDEYIGYYLRMAKGGVEMIWIEDFAAIWSVTASPFKQPFEAYDVKGLIDALHGAGAKVGYQFDTMGSPIGPLDFHEPFLGNYSTEEIKQWVKDIVDIAKKLQNAGFDAFELNYAANNLGQSFLSRARNNRDDEYGPQTLESRTRFLVETVKGIKDACGKDFVVQLLINGIETNDMQLGQDWLYNSVAETTAIAKIAEEAGVDSLHVRTGPASQHIAQFANDLYFSGRGLEGASGFSSFFDFSRHYEGKLRANHSGCGIMLDVAGEIKQALSIPVGCATYNDPAQAPDYFEAAIAEGKVDFLVMNRPLCVDPQYVNKLRDGRIDEIAPCTRCLHCFYDPSPADPMLLEHCRVNAENWRVYGPSMPEGWEPLPAEGDKKVMVIGGGPAGMEAARIAAARGYSTTLYEKNSALGGLLSTAEAIKDQHENLSRLAAYLTKQQEVAGVTVVTGQDVDAAFVTAEAPDVVILAAGAVRAPLTLTGTASTPVLVFADAIGAELGEDITVFGSNCQAIDTAIYLLAQGKRITIVTPDPIELFEKGHSVNVRGFIQPALAARGVRIWPASKIANVGDGEITVTDEAGFDTTFACDAVVEMLDTLPNTSLADELSGIEVIPVGDCAMPYNIAEAIASGNLAARKI